MATFQNIREEKEQKVLVQLLSEIERNPSVTQRGLAGDLNIALGLMNQYLKRCVTKGWVRASQVSPRRISYFLTPEGLLEKSHMVADYLSRSMTFFRDAKSQCEAAFESCINHGWTNLALIGDGDLADIAKLVLPDGVTVELQTPDDPFEGFDAVIITDVINPQGTYDLLKHRIENHRLITLDLLHISRGIS